MPAQTKFSSVFSHLKAILQPFAAEMDLKHDTETLYYLDGPYSEKWKRVLFFASAEIKKNYVSFYLMPVYFFPDLLKDISPGLKKHMQGKSCFNFRNVEPDLFRELAGLASKSAERIQKMREQEAGPA